MVCATCRTYVSTPELIQYKVRVLGTKMYGVTRGRGEGGGGMAGNRGGKRCTDACMAASPICETLSEEWAEGGGVRDEI